MTKAELIARTEYETEDNLIDLALTIAIAKSREWRNNETSDADAWEHYDNLLQAFTQIYVDRIEQNAPQD